MKYSIDFKLKLVEEAQKTNISEVSRKHKVARSCIREWIKDKEKLSEILTSQSRISSKINGTGNSIAKYRLAGGGRKVLDGDMEDLLFEWIKTIGHKDFEPQDH